MELRLAHIESNQIATFSRRYPSVILSAAKELHMRNLRSFAVFAAQDDGGIPSLIWVPEAVDD
jgi:hypothetical protein